MNTPSDTFPGARLLLVDDEPSLSNALREILGLAGYDVAAVGNGKSALALMESWRPDLILSDIVMPELDGYGFFEAVRRRPEWLDIPFLFLSAKDEKPDVRLGKLLGADDYLTKPFDPEDLLVSIRAKLHRRAELEALNRERAQTLKQTIVRTLSHEFRTPLTTIAAYVDLLDDAGGGRLPPEDFRKFMRAVRRGSQRLGQLVEDFLLLADLETGEARTNLEHRHQRISDLTSVIAHTIDRLPAKAAARNVSLVINLPTSLPAVDGDPRLIADALERLVDNGIKFSRETGGTVVVSAEAGEGMVRIAVRDDGIGIRADDLPNLFDVFFQIDRAKREQQGSGTGLAIAQGIARLHGGQIRVESWPDVGSTFIFELPIQVE